MALPLLVPIAIGLSGLYGAAKGVKAVCDSSEAKSINRTAQRIVEETEERIEAARVAANSALEDFGNKKYTCITGDLQRFIQVYARLKGVQLSTTALKELSGPNSDMPTSVQELADKYSLLIESTKGLGTGALGGAMAAFGAYNGTMLLASAGTGTAISSLSGAAATNATLAWLGGGSLASGGLGVAGGTIVLGVMAAGPALLIFGSILGAKAQKSLADAKANLEQAQTYEESANLVITKLQGISDLTRLASDTLSNVRGRLRRSCKNLASYIDANGEQYSDYSLDGKKLVFTTVKYAQLLKALIDTPLLTEDGSIVEDAQPSIEAIRVALLENKDDD